MAHELPKTYDPGAIEKSWAEYWVKEKLFAVETPPATAEDGCAATADSHFCQDRGMLGTPRD